LHDRVCKRAWYYTRSADFPYTNRNRVGAEACATERRCEGPRCRRRDCGIVESGIQAGGGQRFGRYAEKIDTARSPATCVPGIICGIEYARQNASALRGRWGLRRDESCGCYAPRTTGRDARKDSEPLSCECSGLESME